ncbi:cbb3-type cytochrome c oxidase N-terminal domain-containing protein [Actomonas aquatica]|uniref:Cbb3-type cytochrome c oxidase N-terminal domain-containing protein n=1 Tax=Actomonas aquatica TaxID=2866162 RepID=A0ABZ1C782_9BACT|nr:cbb3-type cytochrome c oxidase N-terminal domain-containing protein [Opitutus sp. WL0086]WRQ87366.1 cbb3-type cytochrome c oxidase N-terminal domain-containing protein [Opitutus sp. WL0086]
MSDSEKYIPPEEGSIREHVYDGIEEFNKRLPNWWLFTLYIAIVFWVGYWFYYAQSGIPMSDGDKIDAEIARIQAAKLSTDLTIDDPSLWAMSQNPTFIANGKATYDSLCVACHLPSLRGKGENPAAIGPDLTDDEWIHGSAPTNLFHTVENGVATAGMPAWGPVLGTEKTAEVVAYVLSHHQAP